MIRRYISVGRGGMGPHVESEAHSDGYIRESIKRRNIIEHSFPLIRSERSDDGE